ncbi:MAG: hypothetical protein JO100_09440 [Pseudonocardia sp.]|nr:hypothetical protein [Pseudonocardia sp.]
MLKKAGIVVAAASAGLLAVSPLAFAQGGLISVDDDTVQVPIQACGNDIITGVIGILAKDQKNKQDGDVHCDQDSRVTNNSHSDDD